MSNKKGSAPPRYDEAFKKGAMALVTEKGMPLKTAAKDLGICPDTLRSWLNASGYKPAEVAKQHRADKRLRLQACRGCQAAPRRQPSERT